MTQAHSVTPLRQRMLDDMKLRNMAVSTRKIYVSSVAGFSAYHGRSPDQLTLEDVRDYQLHLVARGLKASSICPIMSALRFFYGTTLGDREAAAEIPLPRKADPLPAILSPDEVKRLLTAVPDRKMRTLLTTVYAAGLRVSEVVGLQVGDIDSARMTIHVSGRGSGLSPCCTAGVRPLTTTPMSTASCRLAASPSMAAAGSPADRAFPAGAGALSSVPALLPPGSRAGP